MLYAHHLSISFTITLGKWSQPNICLTVAYFWLSGFSCKFQYSKHKKTNNTTKPRLHLQKYGPDDTANHQDVLSAPLVSWEESSFNRSQFLESSGVHGKTAPMVKLTWILVWYMAGEAQESVFSKNSRSL